MNRHEHALHLLRSQVDLELTPAQQLKALELSAASRRRRARAIWKTLGLSALCLATFIATIVANDAGRAELVLEAIAVGVISSLFWIWNGGSDDIAKLPAKTAPAREPNADAATLRAIDERLANLEAILNYEELIAARRNEAAQAEAPQTEAGGSRATRRLGAD